MVIDTNPKTGEKTPRYLIYDAVQIQGRDIINDTFQMRYERLMVSNFDTDICRKFLWIVFLSLLHFDLAGYCETHINLLVYGN